MEVNYKFTLRSPQSENKTAIQPYFYHSGGKFRYNFRTKINPSLWDKETQRPTRDKKIIAKYKKDYPQIKTELEIVSNRIDKLDRLTKEWFANLEMTNNKIDLSELTEYLDPYFLDQSSTKKKKQEKEYSLNVIDLLSKWLQGITSGHILTANKTRYSLGSIKVYKTLLRSFEELQDHNSKKYHITDIDDTLAASWTQYLYAKKSSDSNVGKQHKHFKAAIRHHLDHIEKLNYKRDKQDIEPILPQTEIDRVRRNLKAYKYITSSKTNVALSANELDTLYSMEGLPDHLQKYLDVFLCGCYTATRYSDYSRISKEHIKGEYLEIITLKTKRKVKIPIHPRLRQILHKYDYQLPKTYEQKMNKYIKEIGKLAGIDEPIEEQKNVAGINYTTKVSKYSLLVTHTARRTGATIMNNQGMHYKDIMAITGHKSLASFEKYLKIEDDARIERMKQIPFFNQSPVKKAN